MATQSVTASFVDESGYECIDGQLVRRHRSTPGELHSDIQGAVYRLLWSQQQSNFKVGLEWSLARPGTLSNDEPDYLTADVLVARKPFQTARNGHLIPPACLAVEVVSPGQDSLFIKAQEYAAWGVEFVWIINPQTRECFEYSGGNEFRLTARLLRAADLSVQINDVFEGLR